MKHLIIAASALILSACLPTTPGGIARTVTTVTNAGCDMAKGLEEGQLRDMAKSVCTSPVLDLVETAGSFLPAPEMIATTDSALPQKCRFTRELRGHPEWEEKCASIYPQYVEDVDRVGQAVFKEMLVAYYLELPELSVFTNQEECGGGHSVERVVYCPSSQRIMIRDGQEETYGLERFTALTILMVHEVAHHKTNLLRPWVLANYGQDPKAVELGEAMTQNVEFWCRSTLAIDGPEFGRWQNYRNFMVAFGAGPDSPYGSLAERTELFDRVWVASGCALSDFS